MKNRKRDRRGLTPLQEPPKGNGLLTALPLNVSWLAGCPVCNDGYSLSRFVTSRTGEGVVTFATCWLATC